MKLAYGRVSAKDQTPERQLVKFRELGVEERFIFVDKQSGKDFERPRYQAMREMIREGDLVYLDALDRLGAITTVSSANGSTSPGKLTQTLFVSTMKHSLIRVNLKRWAT